MSDFTSHPNIHYSLYYMQPVLVLIQSSMHLR